MGEDRYANGKRNGFDPLGPRGAAVLMRPPIRDLGGSSRDRALSSVLSLPAYLQEIMQLARFRHWLGGLLRRRANLACGCRSEHSFVWTDAEGSNDPWPLVAWLEVLMCGSEMPGAIQRLHPRRGWNEVDVLNASQVAQRRAAVWTAHT